MDDRAGARADHPDEHEHRDDAGSGLLRASVFGMSDGLVSNLALVMGVAGGGGDAHAIVIAGTAGLLAGAFSMAVGEYVSMATQRESMERQLELERLHIERYPESEARHLVELLVGAGLPTATAEDVARALHRRQGKARDFHAMLELGIMPGRLGAPVGAAVASFVAFTLGAAIPLLPWLLMDGALTASLIVSAIALLLVGGAVTRVTSLGPVAGALRQLGFGAAAAGITYLIGTLVGSVV